MKKIIIRVLIGLVVVAGLIFFVDHTITWGKVYGLLVTLPKTELLFLLSLSFLITVAKAWRFYILLKRANIRIKFFQTVKLFVASQALTPFPGGESGRAIFLKKEGDITFTRSSSPVLIQAFLELFTAAIFLILLSFVHESLFTPAVIITAILSVILLFFLNKKFFIFILRKLKFIPFLSKNKESFMTMQEGARKAVFQTKRRLPSRVFLLSVGIGFIAHVCGGLLVYFIASFYKADLTIFQSTAIYVASVLIQGVVGFVPGGLGFTEGGMAGILYLFKVPATKAIAIVLVFRLTTLVFYIVIGLIFAAIFYGKSILIRPFTHGKK